MNNLLIYLLKAKYLLEFRGSTPIPTNFNSRYKLTGKYAKSNYSFASNKFDEVIAEIVGSKTEISVLSFFTYFLLLNTLLPISLQVAFELCKMVQA